MPIRINLLAEAQALEELRRRDPVKRAIWMGVLLVLLILAWSSSLQLKAIIARTEVSHLEAQVATHTNEYQVVLENQKKLGDVNLKLAELRRLATNRFLNGTLLDALQHTTVDEVQLLRFKLEQSYFLTEEVRPKTTEGRTVAGKAAAVTERIALTLDARAGGLGGQEPLDQVNKFKEAIAKSAYFQNALGKTNVVRLTNLGQQATGPDGRPFVQFTLECRYPERTR